MAIDQTSITATSPTSTAITVTAAAPAKAGGMSFRTLLSDLNPLQYIPVVGSIYRAVTGDEGNATLRFVASLGTSFAMGGPLGVGLTVAEKVTGIDPERIGRHLLSSLFHPSAAKDTTAASATASATATTNATTARPWSASELSAYGVKTMPDKELAAGTLASADVLNTLELRRLATTYA